LTDAQWARAMLDLGSLPPPSRIFSLGFFGENASKSYTAAGAFVSWVIDTYGAATVRAWYGGGSLDELAHASWGEIDDRFRAWLRTLPMPDEASAYARAKFERPSVWARRCPHVVDALDHAADKCRDEHRYVRATALYDDALARDPHDWHARYDRAKVDLWFGDEARAREELAHLADDEQTPRTWRDKARELLADDDLARGRDERAADAYRAIAAASLDEDAARTLEVKALSVSNPPARRAILDLLIGEPGRPVDTWLGALSLGAWAAETREPLAGYLVGKNLGNHEQYVRAAAWLDRAIDAGVPTAHIGREMLRERAVVACALADGAGLDRVRQLVESDDSPFVGGSGGRKEWVLRLVARCGG
jgi:tetratricopeptide repeat protein